MIAIVPLSDPRSRWHPAPRSQIRLGQFQGETSPTKCSWRSIKRFALPALSDVAQNQRNGHQCTNVHSIFQNPIALAPRLRASFIFTVKKKEWRERNAILSNRIASIASRAAN